MSQYLSTLHAKESFESRPLFGKTLFSKEVNRQSQELFPFRKNLRKTIAAYPTPLTDLIKLLMYFSDAIASDDNIRITPSLRSKKGMSYGRDFPTFLNQGPGAP